MGTEGLNAEIAKVTERIALVGAERTGEASLYSADERLRFVRLLRTYALRLHALDEAACNRELTRSERRRMRDTEARVIALVHRLGVTVTLNGDPRGAPIQIPCQAKHSNYASGEHIAIPWLPARDYK